MKLARTLMATSALTLTAGLVNAADLNLLAINWQSGVVAPSLVAFDTAWTAALAGVQSVVIPEPGVASLLTLTGLILGQRIRRV